MIISSPLFIPGQGFVFSFFSFFLFLPASARYRTRGNNDLVIAPMLKFDSHPEQVPLFVPACLGP